MFIWNPGPKNPSFYRDWIKALQNRYKVLFTTTANMLHDLHVSKADNSYHKKIDFYLAPELLIIVDLALKKCLNTVQMICFEIISRRYEHAPYIITTNKTFEQWGEIFADVILASCYS